MPAAAVARMLVFEDGARGERSGTRGSMGGPEIGERLLASPDETAWTLESDDGAMTLYAEAHRRRRACSSWARGTSRCRWRGWADLLGFPVVVLDDREEFATDERFPDARGRRARGFRGARSADWRSGPADFVVLVTRAHRYDFDCLRALLDRETPPRYIGMVGAGAGCVRRSGRSSTGRAAGSAGPIHAPIGVDIGAETPEEIAVSIAAELVAVRRGVRRRGIAAGPGAGRGAVA
jgi:xanthine dehydrogenase accessory factor